MEYESIKNILKPFIGCSVLIYKLILFFLDLVILRSWYIRKEIFLWSKKISYQAKILDAGSGLGQYISLLSKKGSNLNLVSLEDDADKIRLQEYLFHDIDKRNIKFICSNLVDFKRANSFDLVLLVDVLEHIKADQKVLRNMFFSLKKGGLLLISVPSLHDLEPYHSRDSILIAEHVRNGYDPEILHKMLNKAGFSQVNYYYTYGLPGVISWRIGIKYPVMVLSYAKVILIILPIYYVLTLPFIVFLNLCDMLSKQKIGRGLIIRAWK